MSLNSDVIPADRLSAINEGFQRGIDGSTNRRVHSQFVALADDAANTGLQLQPFAVFQIVQGRHLARWRKVFRRRQQSLDNVLGQRHPLGPGDGDHLRHRGGEERFQFRHLQQDTKGLTAQCSHTAASGKGDEFGPQNHLDVVDNLGIDPRVPADIAKCYQALAFPAVGFTDGERRAGLTKSM